MLTEASVLFQQCRLLEASGDDVSRPGRAPVGLLGMANRCARSARGVAASGFLVVSTTGSWPAYASPGSAVPLGQVVSGSVRG